MSFLITYVAVPVVLVVTLSVIRLLDRRRAHR